MASSHDFDYDAFLDAKAQEEEEKNEYRNACEFGERCLALRSAERLKVFQGVNNRSADPEVELPSPR